MTDLKYFSVTIMGNTKVATKSDTPDDAIWEAIFNDMETILTFTWKEITEEEAYEK